jgi:hypothetical protein
VSDTQQERMVHVATRIAPGTRREIEALARDQRRPLANLLRILIEDGLRQARGDAVAGAE